MDNSNENKNTSLSQNKRIYAYLLAGHSITGLDALNLFGCFRLPSRIHDIREKENAPIESRYITLASGKRVKEYFMLTDL